LKVIDDIIAWLRKDYKSILEDGSREMKVNQGKVHKYLGMNLDFSNKHKVKITVVEYVKEIIAAWDKAATKINQDSFETMRKRSKKGRSSATPEDLFKVNKDLGLG